MDELRYVASFGIWRALVIFFVAKALNFIIKRVRQKDTAVQRYVATLLPVAIYTIIPIYNKMFSNMPDELIGLSIINVICFLGIGAFFVFHFGLL